jgi:hypothetical protein
VSLFRPGPGFLVAVALLGGCAGFLAWGLAEPELERVWRLQVGLSSGDQVALSGEERRLLARALRRHPALATAWVEDAPRTPLGTDEDGWTDRSHAYLVRPSTASPGRIEVRYGGLSPEGGVRVIGWTPDARAEGEARAGRPFVWDLPSEGRFHQLVELELRDLGPGGERGRRKHPVRVRRSTP